jgi:hypothetical protein
MTTLATAARDALLGPNRHTRPASPLLSSADDTILDLVPSQRKTKLELEPRPLHVPGVGREIEVKIAAEPTEWEEALQLVTTNYRTRGYEPTSARGLRFTAFHALPDTTTFIAKHNGHVIATLSLVVDNTLLGLPMETIYGHEIQALRQQGRKMGELTSLADSELGVREFLQVFIAMSKLMVHYHGGHGADTCVISVNPRHRTFYSKVMGFVPFGSCRSYPSVQDAPAEAYMVDLHQLKLNAPKMYEEMAREAPPPEALLPRPIPPRLVRTFAAQSSQTDLATVHGILEYVAQYGSPRRW